MFGKRSPRRLDEIQEAMNPAVKEIRQLLIGCWSQFKRLIQELTIPRSTAMPSVPQVWGDDLIDAVEGFVSVRVGAMDPSRQFLRTREINEKIQHYGGFRLVIINGRSGSTDSPINIRDQSSKTVGGSLSYQERRKVNYLVLEALSMFQKLAQQQQSTMAPPPLNIETQILGFPGDSYGISVAEIKPLSRN